MSLLTNTNLLQALIEQANNLADAGGGGGGAKVAYGTLTFATQKTGLHTVEHGMGVAPDFVMLKIVNKSWNDSKTNYQAICAINMQYDLAVKTGATSWGLDFRAYGTGTAATACNNTTFEERYDINGAAGALRNATETTFQILFDAYSFKAFAGDTFMWLAVYLGED